MKGNQMIKIRNARRGINKYGARKYAEVPSHTTPGKKYIVIKIRKKSSKGHNYIYRCNCPRNFYNPSFKCQHIQDFKKVESGR